MDNLPGCCEFYTKECPDLRDLNDRAASDPRETAELLPRLPGESGVREPLDRNALGVEVPPSAPPSADEATDLPEPEPLPGSGVLAPVR
jgi:hypothetical protein